MAIDIVEITAEQAARLTEKQEGHFLDFKAIEVSPGVIVHIKHERLASPEALIMEYLQDHDQINNTNAREICHIGSENRMKRIFDKLMENELIERIPELKGNKTAYRKKSR